MNIKSKMEYQANLSMTASSNISSFDYIGVDLQKFNQFVTLSVNENLWLFHIINFIFNIMFKTK